MHHTVDTSAADKAHATNKAVAPKVAIESNAQAKVVKPDKANEAVAEFDEVDEADKVNATNKAIATNEAEVDEAFEVNGSQGRQCRRCR